MKRIFLSALFAIAAALTLSAQDISGTWAGNVDLSDGKLPLVFHIEKTDGGYAATMDSPDQDAFGMPVESVVFADGVCVIDVADIGMVYTGTVQSATLMEGSFTQSDFTFPLNLERVVLNRPQEPQPPFPYSSEEIVIRNTAEGINLAGTLTYPAGGKKLPAVVMISGGGAQDRNEETAGHKTFMVIADYFAGKGIAVLRMDDRGVGGSEGDLAASTARDLSADIYAAMNYLKTRKEINSKKIGLAGYGEGGAAAFITAAGHPKETAFVIAMAAPGVRGDSISVMQVEDMVRNQGMPENFVKVVGAQQRKELDYLYGNTQEFVAEYLDDIAAKSVKGFAFLNEDAKNIIRAQITASNSTWSRFHMAYDPADDIRAIKSPVLAIGGEKDSQIRSSANLAAIEKYLKEGGNANVTVKEYPGLNHLFQHSETGGVGEYGMIEETISPEVLEDMTLWILKVTK